jgi:uncharacterized protein
VVSASCLYEGTIRHRRFAERPVEFRHALALVYVDLDELPGLLGGRLVSDRPGLVRFRRRDYLGDPALPLGDAVRDTARRLTGASCRGPVRVLTHLRTFGHCFNPVSFYYCMDGAGERPEVVIAEVTNTPWGERRSYAVAASGGGAGVLTGEFDKALHVSPFLDLDYRYRVRLTAPGQTVSVHIENVRAAAGAEGSPGTVDFDATMSLRRRELSPRTVAGMLTAYPFATARVLALIYGHALGLALRRVPIHPHPAGAGP